MNDAVLQYIISYGPIEAWEIADDFGLGSWDLFDILSALEDEGLAFCDDDGNWNAEYFGPQDNPPMYVPYHVGGKTVPEVIRLLEDNLGNITHTAHDLGVHRMTLKRFLEKAGVVVEPPLNLMGFSPDEIHEALIANNGHLSNTAFQLGVDRNALSRFIKKADISYKPPAPPRPELLGMKKGEVVEAMDEAGGVQTVAARLLGVHPDTLGRYLKKVPSARGEPAGPGGYPVDFIINKLRQNRGNVKATALELNIVPVTLTSWLARPKQEYIQVMLRKMRPKGPGGYTIEETVAALDDNDWNIRATARQLRIYDSAIGRWLKKYGFKRPSEGR